ncbi:hypothetical protein CEXT_275681 [Caerostris extrusa]|uniref:Uncharacterized protein n=1 Tax=Caerostris extrusa TaxID=172846 RepID=A0AAV4NJY5_CAEEX|nr:hypothetical protein CEXT_275681 [Caerostris extrusa]
MDFSIENFCFPTHSSAVLKLQPPTNLTGLPKFRPLCLHSAPAVLRFLTDFHCRLTAPAGFCVRPAISCSFPLSFCPCLFLMMWRGVLVVDKPITDAFSCHKNCGVLGSSRPNWFLR